MALDELTTRAVTGDLLVIPLGATEQHGPHLPLGTDTIIATALASSLDAVVAPALPYGSSGEHAGFAGTLSIGREALVACSSSSCARRTSRASCSCARTAATPSRWRRRCGSCATRATPSGPGRRAGTATPTRAASRPRCCSRWRPTLVGAAREPGNVEPLGALMPRLRAGGVRAVAPNGVLGDPRGASAEEGRALLAAATADLARVRREHVTAGR